MMGTSEVSKFTASARLRWLGAAAVSGIVPASRAADADPEAASEQAAKLRRTTFCMTVAPLRVPGATGGPFNPLTIF
jgi:hypothetical protein